MARVTRKEWYRRVNACWPEHVPPLTAHEATRAARRLYRYVTGKTWPGDVVVTSGNRRTALRRGRIVVNPDGGWRELVHLLSHYLEWYAGTHGHTAAHARLEMRMIKEVVRRGWLDGKLKPAAPAAAPAATLSDARKVGLARTLAAIARWEAKQRRAENALRKLTRRKRYYERAIAAREAGESVGVSRCQTAR
jgi:hypothetical protein